MNKKETCIPEKTENKYKREEDALRFCSRSDYKETMEIVLDIIKKNDGISQREIGEKFSRKYKGKDVVLIYVLQCLIDGGKIKRVRPENEPAILRYYIA